MENVRGTQGMTISGTEAVKKILERVSAKMAVSKSKSPLLNFHWFAFAYCHARIFLIAVVELLAWLVFRGLNNLCAALRFNLEACRRMPGAGGTVCRQCGRLDYPSGWNLFTSSLSPSISFCWYASVALM